MRETARENGGAGEEREKEKERKREKKREKKRRRVCVGERRKVVRKRYITHTHPYIHAHMCAGQM